MNGRSWEHSHTQAAHDEAKEKKLKPKASVCLCEEMFQKREVRKAVYS